MGDVKIMDQLRKFPKGDVEIIYRWGELGVMDMALRIRLPSKEGYEIWMIPLSGELWGIDK
jgi:hypothetical protein